MSLKTRPVAAAFVLLLLVTLGSGKVHDYVAYVEQWASILKGDVPWRLELADEPKWNTYGPLFLIFAPVYWLHYLAPKLLFALTWFAGYLYLARRAAETGAHPETARRWLFGGYLFAPFYWVDLMYFGHFDIVVAWLVVAACLMLGRSRGVWAALALGASILLKFAPIALLPLFCLDGRRPRVVFAALTLALVAAGMGTAYAVWGEAAWYPLIVSAHRGPKLMSIFAYTNGLYSPIRLWWQAEPYPDPSVVGLPLMILGILAVAALQWYRRLDLLLAVSLGAMVIVTFFRVGHPQFFTMPLVLIFAWLAEQGFRPLSDRRLAKALKAFVIWMSGTVLLYTWTGAFYSGPWPFVREILGIPAFVMDLWLISALVRHALTPLPPEPREAMPPI